MANILIIDDQEWVKELYKEGLKNEAHTVSVMDDVELVMKSETDL
jgi:DNA-binding NtrC family response regulator